jgi:DNA invertase Pin-like site-specific DNA recombinase
MCLQFLNLYPGSVVAEFTEIESGKREHNRPELDNALSFCRKNKCCLLVATLSRLTRNAEFFLAVQRSKVQFAFADMPGVTDRLVLGIMALVAEDEAKRISERTKAALAAAKARGTRLGSYSAILSEKNRQKADKKALGYAPTIMPLVQQGQSLSAIATHLTELGIETPSGGKIWNKITVYRQLKYIRRATPAPSPVAA